MFFPVKQSRFFSSLLCLGIRRSTSCWMVDATVLFYVDVDKLLAFNRPSNAALSALEPPDGLWFSDLGAKHHQRHGDLHVG